MNLKRRVLLGSIWSLFGGGGQQIISLALFIYLARLLAPSDVGLIAFAMVIIDISAFVSRCGQVELIQRQSDLTERTVNTSFWMLTIGGILMTGAIMAAVKVFERATSVVPVTEILLWLAPLCAFQAFGAVPEALMKRRLDFRSLAIRSWTATVAGGILAIILVHLDYGVYALVGQRLATALVQTIVLWMLVGWRPRCVFNASEAPALAFSGAEIMIAGCAGILNQRIVDSIVGLVLGASQLGFLRLGWRFFDFTVQFAVAPISSVALSSFSKLQHDRPALRRAYLRLTQFMAVASLPMFFGFGAIADLFVPLVFGDKWSGSIIILQLLGFAILPGTINYFFGAAMIAVGKSRVVLQQSVVQVFMTLVLVLIGSHFGIGGAMLAIIARAVLVSIYNLYALRNEVGLSSSSVFRTLLPPTLASGAMVAVVWSSKVWLHASLSDLVLMIALIAIGIVTYCLVFLAGDLVGIWPGYIRSAIDSLSSTAKQRQPVDRKIID